MRKEPTAELENCTILHNYDDLGVKSGRRWWGRKQNAKRTQELKNLHKSAQICTILHNSDDISSTPGRDR
jgi:hypothetical protein